MRSPSNSTMLPNAKLKERKKSQEVSLQQRDKVDNRNDLLTFIVFQNI